MGIPLVEDIPMDMDNLVHLGRLGPMDSHVLIPQKI